MRVKFKSTLRYWDPVDESVDWEGMGISMPKPSYRDLSTYVDIEMQDVKRANPTEDGLSTNLWMKSGEKIAINHKYEDYCQAFGILDFEIAEQEIHEANSKLDIQKSTDILNVG